MKKIKIYDVLYKYANGCIKDSKGRFSYVNEVSNFINEYNSALKDYVRVRDIIKSKSNRQCSAPILSVELIRYELEVDADILEMYNINNSSDLEELIYDLDLQGKIIYATYLD